MDLHLKLLTLVQPIIGQNLDDQERYSHQLILFGWHYLLHLTIVDPELFLRHLISLLPNLLDQVRNLLLFKRHVDVHSEEAHERDHQLLFQRIRQNLCADDREFQLQADKVDFVEREFLLFGEVVVTAEHEVQFVGKWVEVDWLLGEEDVGYWFVVVHQATGGVGTVADLEYLELGAVDEL